MAEQIIANWNGQNQNLSQLLVPVEDRAFFFGDAVYEVISIYNGKPFLFEEHLARLQRSLSAVKMTCKINFKDFILKNISDNFVTHGMVYVQVSRGTAPRAHSFYKLLNTPNVLIYTKSAQGLTSEEDFRNGISAITYEDMRWGRCDIKSTNLLANCMAQSAAYEKEAKEAIFIHKDLGLTEGSASNVFVVKNGTIFTAPLSNHILPGTVRAHLIQLLHKNGLLVIERPLTKAELFDADEVFITSTTREALGVVKIDQEKVALGKVGPITKGARELIQASIEKH